MNFGHFLMRSQSPPPLLVNHHSPRSLKVVTLFREAVDAVRLKRKGEAGDYAEQALRAFLMDPLHRVPARV